jgi:hypothetical protein
MRGTTTGTLDFNRDRIVPAGFDGFQLPSVFKGIVVQQLLVAESVNDFNNRQTVYSKPVVLGTGEIDLWRLERYVFHNKQ